MKRFQNLKSRLVAGSAVAGTALTAAGPAFAQSAVDVSGVTSAIEGAAAPIAAIGGAVLLILVGIKVYKWVRRAM